MSVFPAKSISTPEFDLLGRRIDYETIERTFTNGVLDPIDIDRMFMMELMDMNSYRAATETLKSIRQDIMNMKDMSPALKFRLTRELLMVEGILRF